MQPTEQQLEEQRKRMEKEARVVISDARAVFGSVEGQRLLGHLQRKFGFGQSVAAVGMRTEDLWLKSGGLVPFYYINNLLSTELPSQEDSQ